MYTQKLKRCINSTDIILKTLLTVKGQMGVVKLCHYAISKNL